MPRSSSAFSCISTSRLVIYLYSCLVSLFAVVTRSDFDAAEIRARGN